MALEVFWTDVANEGLDEIIKYLSEKWSEKEIEYFFKRLEKCIEKIKEAPHRQKDSLRKSGAKEFQHSPQTTIFYSYDKTTIYILRLWINSKDPNEL